MTSRLSSILQAAGLAGGAVMVAGEKIEQAITHRPNSYVPARTLLTLLGHQPGEDARPVAWNHLMHYSTAATLGGIARDVGGDRHPRRTRQCLAHRNTAGIRPDP